MKIKRFKAKTFAEALTLVKREMGKDAVILSSEEQKGLARGVEVTAAVDYELEAAQVRSTAYAQYTGTAASPGTITPSLLAPRRAALNQNEKRRSASLQHPDSQNISDIREKIGSLKSMIENMQKTAIEVDPPEQKKKVFSYLRKRAVGKELALQLSRGTAKMEDLAGAIAGEIRTYDEVQNRKVIMLIGPTGVGKTTTLAKLAARAIKNGKKVAMINLDTYRIGAIEQIRIYAKIMGIPLDVASNIDGLKKSVEKFGKRDIILVDTTGRNPRDQHYLEELRHIYGLGIPIETHLLMSASSDDDFLVEAYRHYKNLPIDCIAFTKTDEAVKYGSIYNLATLYRKPVGYITTGQSVPADIEFPNSLQLAKMILKNEAA